MDFSYFFNSGRLEKEKLLSCGFVPQGDGFVAEKDMEGEFSARITISGQTISVDAIEKSVGEKYPLLDVKNARGSFVQDLREKIQAVMDDLAKNCFVSDDLTEKYIDWLESTFNVKGEFPWEKFGDNEVFRCPNKKWFALVMEIPFNRLGINSDLKVHVVNLKAENIPELVDNKSIFPAWHMNRKYWITVLLTAITDFNKLSELTRKSYQIVSSKKSKK